MIQSDWAAEEDKVFRAFFAQGRLKTLPVKFRKRLLVSKGRILQSLLVQRVFARLFEPGKRFEEKEVNVRIGRMFPDYCTIRRELVDIGFMARDGGSYWRLQEDDWLPLL